MALNKALIFYKNKYGVQTSRIGLGANAKFLKNNTLK